MELAIVREDTGELENAASALLRDLAGSDGAPHPKAKHELFEHTIEIITGVSDTVGEARTDLTGTLAEIDAVAGARDLRLFCAGSHPFSHWNEGVVSPDPRYKALIREMAWLAQRLQIFGVHVHVGVSGAEPSIAIANALTGYLPHFLALSSSSPFWEGHDTGLASSRVKVFEGLPTAGLPYRLDDWADFERFMATLKNARAITSIREVWWDVRPHPDFGTVELRICDGIPTLHEVTAVAALAQSMVSMFETRLAGGRTLPFPSEWVLRQNKWRATRYGLDADLIVDELGHQRPLREAIAELVDEVGSFAAELGCSAELTGVDRILADGASSERQRSIVAAGGTLPDVVKALVSELATDVPVLA
ncbi:MAG: putative carboxylate-amine ligase [Actinomycetia bacterium]|nr:putative carboxylate-amine ligase [Actinomycetes bacterium]